MFVTAVFAMIWPETGQLLYANAGHNLPLIVRNCDSNVEPLPKGGMAMGVYENIGLVIPGAAFMAFWATRTASSSFFSLRSFLTEASIACRFMPRAISIPLATRSLPGLGTLKADA